MKKTLLLAALLVMTVKAYAGPDSPAAAEGCPALGTAVLSASAYLEKNAAAKAVDTLEQALVQASGARCESRYYFAAYFIMGEARVQQKNYLRAIDNYEKALAAAGKLTSAGTDPSDEDKAAFMAKVQRPRILAQLVLCNIKTGQLDAAIKAGAAFIAFEQNAGRDDLKYLDQNMPLSANVYYNLGCCYALKDEKDRALEYLQKSILREPELKNRMPQDPDLKLLYGDERFKALCR